MNEKNEPILNDLDDIKHNYDFVIKNAFNLFKNKDLAFLGLDIDAKIVEVLSTEDTKITAKKTYSDLLFKLEYEKDSNIKKGLHIEWEADISKDDILRFAMYHVNATRTHKLEFTTIIFTRGKGYATEFISPSLNFHPIIINLSERDGDALLKKLEKQIQNGEQINELELIYLSLYGSKKYKIEELLEKVIKLTAKAKLNEETASSIIAMSFIVSNRYISGEIIEKLWRDAKMTLEGIKIFDIVREEAKEEAKKETERKYLKVLEEQKLKAKKEKIEAERKIEKERIRAEEKIEQERLKAEQKIEQERIKAEEKAKKERLEAEEKAKKERLEAEEKIKQERIKAEEKAKNERLEAEEKIKQERIKAEEKAKKERLEAEEKIEQERIKAEEKAKKERLEAEEKIKQEKIKTAEQLLLLNLTDEQILRVTQLNYDELDRLKNKNKLQ